MRIEDPSRRSSALHIVEREPHYVSLWDRAKSWWAVIPFVPSLLLAQAARRTHDGMVAAWALVLAVAIPAVSFAAFFAVNFARRTAAHARTRRDYDNALGALLRMPLAQGTEPTGGPTRARGTIRRPTLHDAFDARQPLFFVEGEHGVAVVDDDCLVLVGCNGGLPPDGTAVEVGGPARRGPHPSLHEVELDEALVFDGTLDHPILVAPAQTQP